MKTDEITLAIWLAHFNTYHMQTSLHEEFFITMLKN